MIKLKLYGLVCDIMSKILWCTINPDPCLCLLNDDTVLSFKVIYRRFLFCAFTAAKKSILEYWYNQNINLVKTWLINAKYMANLEYSTARLNRAKPETVSEWSYFVFELNERLRGQ